MGVAFLAEAQNQCSWAYYLLKILVVSLLIQETHTFVGTGISLRSSLGQVYLCMTVGVNVYIVYEYTSRGGDMEF